MLELTQETFQKEVQEEAQLVVVDFWAEWCGPCKMLIPILEDLAKEYSGIKFVKVNVDDNNELAIRYGIRSIPALILFKGGKPIDQIIGALPKGVIAKKLDTYVD